MAWWNADWGRKRAVTISAADVPEDLVDFPVLIEISATAGKNNQDITSIFDYTQANGEDFRAVSGDEVTVLDYEIELWDSVNKKAIIWVRLPSISSTSDTTFYIYYDNPAAVDAQNPTGVWDANFKMVLHMNQDPSGAAPQLLDSTINDADATTAGAMTSADLVDGKVGKAINFDGVDDKATVPDAKTSFTGSLTLEAWIYMDVGDFDEGIMEKKTASGGYVLLVDNYYGNDKPAFFVYTTATDRIRGATTLAAGTWYHLTGVFDSAVPELRIYLNGVEDNPPVAASATAIADNTVNLDIAYDTASGNYTDGKLDELRISTVARSAGWISVNFKTQSDTLLVFGAEELPMVEGFTDLANQLIIRQFGFSELSSVLLSRAIGFTDLTSQLLCRAIGFEDLSSELSVGPDFINLPSQLILRQFGKEDLSSRLEIFGILAEWSPASSPADVFWGANFISDEEGKGWFFTASSTTPNVFYWIKAENKWYEATFPMSANTTSNFDFDKNDYCVWRTMDNELGKCSLVDGSYTSYTPPITPPAEETKFEGGSLIAVDDSGSTSTIYFGRGSNDPLWMSFDPTTLTWTLLADFAYGFVIGSDAYFDGSKIWATSPNTAGNYLRSYDPATNSWTAVGPVPAIGGAAGAIVVKDNIVYIVLGGESDKFYKYDVLGATYTELAPLPEVVGEWTGARLSLIDGEIYFLHGGSAVGRTRNVWRYDIEKNRWTPLLYPFSKGEGLSLVATPFAVYAIYGLDFARWNFLENSWSKLPPPPEPVYSGGCLTWDGDRFLYMTAGGYTASFYRFDLQEGTWTKLPDTLADLRIGSRILHFKSKIYCTRGDYTDSFYVFNVENLKWYYLPSLPVGAGDGADIAGREDDDFFYLTFGANNPSFYKFNIKNQQFTALSSLPKETNNGSMAGSPILPHPELDYIIFIWGSTAGPALIDNKLWAYDEKLNLWRSIGTSLPRADGQKDGRRTVFLRQTKPYSPRLFHLSILSDDFFQWESIYTYAFSELIGSLWCRLGITDLPAKLLIPLSAFEWLAGSVRVGVYVDSSDLAGLLNVRYAFSELAGLLGVKYLHTDLLASLYLRPPYAPLESFTVIRRRRWSTLWSLLRIGTKPLFGNLLLRRMETKTLMGEIHITAFHELPSIATIAQFDFSDISSSLIVLWFTALSNLPSSLCIRTLGYSTLASNVYIPRYLGALGIRGKLYVPRYLGEVLLEAYLNIRKIQAITEIEFAPKTSDIELLLHSLKIELEKLKCLIEFRKEGLG